VVVYVRSTAAPHDHAVNFYDDDAEWVDRVAAFVVDGLALGERVIVVATAKHLALLEGSLPRVGLDPLEARTTGRLLTLDAQETLSSFMSDGVPNAPQLVSSVGSLIDGVTGDGSPVRIFGEMVALLWHHGDVAAAIELESLWNDLARDRHFSLMCAYALSVVGEASLDDLDRVCEMHSSLVPPRSYTSGAAGTPTGTPGATQASKIFVCVPAAVPAVRRFVTDVLARWGRVDAIPDATLVASELATNALRHARSPFRVSVDRSGSTVRIAVEDVGRVHPARCQPTVEATWGRGVVIVEQVCQAWGSDPLSRGKVVWADLRGPN
jgi:MEDS: MEthanogen/methylotroph, DcmR Sensory domain/Histidine kinase-like ATPase domain